MPIDYKTYPANWPEIRERIKLRAKDNCELCGAPNGVIIQRIIGAEYPWYAVKNATDGDVKRMNVVKIILTIHHINADKTDNREINLIGLCQKCHLRLDQPFKHKRKE